MTKPIITQSQLKEILRYCPITGFFRWMISPTNSVKIGQIAGTINDSGKGSYSRININLSGRVYKAHRLVWLYVYGEWPEYQIDHINGDSCDNRLSNLRDVKQEMNMRNARLPSTNTSGHIGVTWDSSRSKWVAQISIKDKCFRLGRFDNIDDAISARKKGAEKYGFTSTHGRLYHPNAEPTP